MENVTPMLKKDDIPTCFGDSCDPNEAACAGGPDPKFVHPKNGSHVRPPCDFFQMCGTYTRAKKVASQQVIPPQSLIRPTAPMVPVGPPAPPESTFRAYIQQQMAQRPVPIAYPPVPAPYPQAPIIPVPQQYQYPAPAYQLQYMVPGYITVPEQRMEGESYGGLLMRELLRGGLKAMGHTLANFFDMNPFRLPPRQGGGGQ
jgi:hypothetical protein